MFSFAPGTDAGLAIGLSFLIAQAIAANPIHRSSWFAAFAFGGPL